MKYNIMAVVKNKKAFAIDQTGRTLDLLRSPVDVLIDYTNKIEEVLVDEIGWCIKIQNGKELIVLSERLRFKKLEGTLPKLETIAVLETDHSMHKGDFIRLPKKYTKELCEVSQVIVGFDTSKNPSVCIDKSITNCVNSELKETFLQNYKRLVNYCNRSDYLVQCHTISGKLYRRGDSNEI